MSFNTTTVKRITVLENHHCINSLKNELKQSVRVNGLRHPETLAISQKLDKYIIEYQYINLGILRNRNT
jgi:hypothetical protein